MRKSDGSGWWIHKDGNTWYGVRYPVFLEHVVPHDENATWEAIKASGALVVEMVVSPTGVMLPKELPTVNLGE